MAFDRGLADRVRSILERRPGFSERRMFGGIAFMINGHMCCGVLKTDLMLRLTPEAVINGLRQPHTRPMDFTGKPMRSMMFVDAIGTDSDDAVRKWVECALAVALSRPPKKLAAGETRPAAR